MVTCVIFGTENGRYKEIHGNLPIIGRTHRNKQKTSYKYLIQFFEERCYKDPRPTKYIVPVKKLTRYIACTR